jgi:FkbM family methyltransferase
MDLYTEHLATWSRQSLEAAICRRVQTAYLGEGIVLARILGRQKIFLHSSDRGFACHLMLDGFWEMWLTQYLARCVRPGMTVIDVGANYGYYTLLLADAVGEAGHVIAVEPNPAAVTLLGQSVLLNGHSGRTQIVPHALGATAGKRLLFLPSGEPKNATLVDREDVINGRTIEVSTVTLDEIALTYPKVDLVKIDAEGGEQEILAGMPNLIERDRPMLVLEYNAARYAEPYAFLEKLLTAYSTAEELELTGNIVPINIESVTDPTHGQDRLLLFR